MKTVWLIEKDLHEPEFYQRMEDALMQNDIHYRMVSYDNNQSKHEQCKHYLHVLTDIMPEARWVIPYGSVDFVKCCHDVTGHIGRAFNFKTFFDLHKLSFEQYTVHGAKYMLNQNFVIISYAELKRRRDFFFNIFGKDIGKGKAIFVRPVSNDKVFTGRLFYDDSFEREIVYMGYSKPPQMDPAMLVVVASPVELIKEYRFAIVDTQVVAATCYQQWMNGLPDNEEIPGCDNMSVRWLAEKIAMDKQFNPDDAYILDIASTPDGPGMIEIGSINSAGWYAMDCDAIITALAKLAEKH